MASVHICELPLQLMLHRHPDWRSRPAAVVDQDRAQGVLLWVNEAARRCQILPGMRYAAGLSLDRDLCAGTVSPDEIDQAGKRLFQLLHQFAPRIEQVREEPGQFFLDLQGLDWSRISAEAWAEQTAKAVFDAGFLSKVVLGFQRFALDAASHCGWGPQVFSSPEEERLHLRATPIDRLPIPPQLRDRLQKLGIDTLSAFLDLPSDGIRRRFGRETWLLHRQAQEETGRLDADAPPKPSTELRLDFDYGETDQDRLMEHLETMLDTLMCRLGEQQEALAALRLFITLEDHSHLRTVLTPARPSLDRNEICKLLALRLERLAFTAAVEEVCMQVRGQPVGASQFELWQQRTRRNPDDARKAFAELRAEFGNELVQRAELQNTHLPETQFVWNTLDHLPAATPSATLRPRLIRRLHTHSHRIAPPFRPTAPPENVLGPHLVSDNWWTQKQERAYFYQPVGDGSWRWIYFDLRKKEWAEQGTVS